MTLPNHVNASKKNSQSSTVVTDINYTTVLYEALKFKSKEINKLRSEKEKVEKRCRLIKTEKRHVVGKLFDANKKAEQLMLDKQRCINKINILSVRNTLYYGVCEFPLMFRCTITPYTHTEAGLPD